MEKKGKHFAPTLVSVAMKSFFYQLPDFLQVNL